MNSLELTERRREKWRANGNPVRTFEAARDFLEDVGLCVMYPEPRQSPAPSLMAAWLGRDHSLPIARAAFAHPEAAEAEAMKLRLVREHAAYEWPLRENVLLVAASVFPFFYALAGDRAGRQQPAWSAGQKLSKLSRDAWTEFERANQPIGEDELRQQLGKGVSEAALRRALHELWQRLRIQRINRNERGEAWEPLGISSRKALNDADQLSVPSALSALISKYLDAVIAAEPQQIEVFFSPLVARSKVRDAIHALLAAREITTIQIGNHSMLQITPPKAAVVPRAARQATPREHVASDQSKRRTIAARGRKPA